MTRNLKDEIQKEISENRIIIYMKGTREAPRCGFSAATVQVLNEYAVPYKDINVLEDQEKWAAIKEFSDWPTIPQVYIDGHFVGGCDIVREMHAKGELAPLIRKATGS
ncbi:MAG TPA: Grx4 family monothiol glutaredoxin [Patescibacteria group bacterium]|jgi:monothiol glutaredoxin|nr:Grx4 family monothiol glutaredoxin [Patescibacteria group bacterium]